MKASLRALLLTGLLAAATLGAGPVMSQDLKIGYVNSERVLRDAAPAKAAQAKLEAEFGRRERDLVEQTNRLKAAADKLEKDGPTLSETERNRRQRELVDQDRDLQRKRREFQEDLNQRRNEEIAAIQERWTVEDEWWREPLHREYLTVMTAAGSVRTIYTDTLTGQWFAQSY